MKETEFVVLLTFTDRYRHYHLSDKGRVIKFTVQYEILIQGKWHPVVRYDTAHQYAHKDILHPNGRVDKTPLYLSNYNVALAYAESDIKSNWIKYRNRYLKEKEQ